MSRILGGLWRRLLGAATPRRCHACRRRMVPWGDGPAREGDGGVCLGCWSRLAAYATGIGVELDDGFRIPESPRARLDREVAARSTIETRRETLGCIEGEGGCICCDFRISALLGELLTVGISIGWSDLLDSMRRIEGVARGAFARQLIEIPIVSTGARYDPQAR